MAKMQRRAAGTDFLCGSGVHAAIAAADIAAWTPLPQPFLAGMLNPYRAPAWLPQRLIAHFTQAG